MCVCVCREVDHVYVCVHVTASSVFCGSWHCSVLEGVEVYGGRCGGVEESSGRGEMWGGKGKVVW